MAAAPSETRVVALTAGDALALLLDPRHPFGASVSRVTAVAVGSPDETGDSAFRGTDPSVLVAALSRRYPDAHWFVTASFGRDFPYNLARRIGSLAATALGRVGVALVPGSTELPTERRASTGELLDSGIDALRGLWESWPLESIVADRESRRFVDSSRIVRVDRSNVFRVRGPLQVPVEAGAQPVVAVWAEEVPGGADLAFTANGLIVDAHGRRVGTIERPDDASPVATPVPDTADLRSLLGLAHPAPTLTHPIAAFPERAVLQ